MSCITGMLAALRNGLFIWLDERRHNTSTGTVHDASEVRYLKTSSRDSKQISKVKTHTLLTHSKHTYTHIHTHILT